MNPAKAQAETLYREEWSDLDSLVDAISLLKRCHEQIADETPEEEILLNVTGHLLLRIFILVSGEPRAVERANYLYPVMKQ